MWTWLLELVPERRRDAIDEIGARAWTVLTAYTRGVVFVATVDAVLIGVALLVVGVPLALPLIVYVAGRVLPDHRRDRRGSGRGAGGARGRRADRRR